MNEDRDLTKGKPLSLILSFAFSLIVGNVFQQLYIIVDSIIIGQKVGAKGLSAIGGTDWYIFLVNGFIIGLIQGFSVLLGNKYGEKDEAAFSQYYKKAKAICFGLTISLVALLLGTSGFVLRVLDTKDEVFSFAKTYVDVIFAGLPFLIFYQLFAAVLRSRGNSKTHLMAMTVSSLCNIVLDILFVSALNMGIGGAALGTILSECLVMLICGYNVYKNRQGIADETIHRYRDCKRQGIFIWIQLSAGTGCIFPASLHFVYCQINLAGYGKQHNSYAFKLCAADNEGGLRDFLN